MRVVVSASVSRWSSFQFSSFQLLVSNFKFLVSSFQLFRFVSRFQQQSACDRHMLMRVAQRISWARTSLIKETSWNDTASVTVVAWFYFIWSHYEKESWLNVKILLNGQRQGFNILVWVFMIYHTCMHQRDMIYSSISPVEKRHSNLVVCLITVISM